MPLEMLDECGQSMLGRKAENVNKDDETMTMSKSAEDFVVPGTPKLEEAAQSFFRKARKPSRSKKLTIREGATRGKRDFSLYNLFAPPNGSKGPHSHLRGVPSEDIATLDRPDLTFVIVV